MISNNLKMGIGENTNMLDEKSDDNFKNNNDNHSSNSRGQITRSNFRKTKTSFKLNNIIESRKSLYVTESNGTDIRELMESKEKKLSQVSWNALNKIFTKKNQGFYCPHCTHCNNIKDEVLDTYLSLKEAKIIINKGFDYICEYYVTDQSYLDLLLNENNNSKITLKIDSNNTNVNNINNPKNKSTKKLLENNIHFPLSISNLNNNINIKNSEIENIKDNKKKNKFEMESLLITYPKTTKDRNVLQLVTHFLDALISDKISINSIVSIETYEKLKDSLISQGVAFKEKGSEIEFDKEIDLLFDQNTKEKIKNLFSGIKNYNYYLSIVYLKYFLEFKFNILIF
jgi:hypothetical protein